MAWTKNPYVISTVVEDGTVLLNPQNQALFTLNPTGAVVWEHIGDGIEACVAELVARFDTTPTEAHAAAESLIEDLRLSGLIEDTAE